MRHRKGWLVDLSQPNAFSFKLESNSEISSMPSPPSFTDLFITILLMRLGALAARKCLFHINLYKIPFSFLK